MHWQKIIGVLKFWWLQNILSFNQLKYQENWWFKQAWVCNDPSTDLILLEGEFRLLASFAAFFVGLFFLSWSFTLKRNINTGHRSFIYFCICTLMVLSNFCMTYQLIETVMNRNIHHCDWAGPFMNSQLLVRSMFRWSWISDRFEIAMQLLMELKFKDKLVWWTPDEWVWFSNEIL